MALLLGACLLVGGVLTIAAGETQDGPALIVTCVAGPIAGALLLAFFGRRRAGDPTPAVAPQFRRYLALLCWSGLLVVIDLALPGSCTATVLTALPIAAVTIHALNVAGTDPFCVASEASVSALLAVGPNADGVVETVSRRKPRWVALAGVLTLTGGGARATRQVLNEVERHGTKLLLVDGSLESLGITGLAAVQERGVAVWLLADSLHRPARVRRLRGLAGLLWQPLPRIGLSRGRLAGKRAFDVGTVLLALPLALPLAALLATAVKLTSRGPVIYSQLRVGARGERFVICKFRTMVESAEADGRATMAGGRSDPRLTSFGRYLRNSRLDELPQLWNILRGHMSVVGPRPERPVFVNEFAERIPEYHYRHLVPVGLTGLAQLTGDYASTPEEKLQADLLYASNWSILLDLALVARTAAALVGGSLDPDWIDTEAVPEEFAQIAPLPAQSEAS